MWRSSSDASPRRSTPTRSPGPHRARASTSGLRPRGRKSRSGPVLTPQEHAVAQLVIRGLTNREVASELVVSAKTVEHHLSRTYAKLGVRSRTELASALLSS